MELFDDQFIDDEVGTKQASQTQDVLIDTQQRLGMVLDVLPAGLFIHQLQGILFANQLGLEMVQENSESVVGKHLMDYVDPDRRDECMELFMRALTTDSISRVEAVNIYIPGGDVRIMNIIMAKLPWEGQDVLQAVLEDVTLLKNREAELERMTMIDPLTGALNRRYFIEKASKEVEIAIRDGRPYAMIVFDLDHFKKINDNYGHHAGDKVLKDVVDLWRTNRRQGVREGRKPDGELARIGGEEFAILLPGSSKAGAKSLAERLRQTIDRRTFKDDGKVLPVAASFGVTEILKTDKNIDDLIRRADAALYVSKENGRNQVSVA